MTLFFSLNAFAIIGYYKTLAQHSDHIMLPTVYAIIIIVLIGVFNYVYFLSNKKYETIYNDYKQNTSMSGSRGTWVTVVYIFLTLAMLISLIWLARMNIK